MSVTQVVLSVAELTMMTFSWMLVLDDSIK